MFQPHGGAILSLAKTDDGSPYLYSSAEDRTVVCTDMRMLSTCNIRLGLDDVILNVWRWLFLLKTFQVILVGCHILFSIQLFYLFDELNYCGKWSFSICFIFLYIQDITPVRHVSVVCESQHLGIDMSWLSVSVGTAQDRAAEYCGWW